MTGNQPSFTIGDVPIYGDLILAPMDGITDQPFRKLCRRLGSAITVTEFINAIDVMANNPRYPKRTVFDDDQRPVSLQLLGDNPERMLKAAIQLIERFQPDILDINLGCQSKKVTGRGAGAALLRQPEKIGKIFTLMSHQFEIPVTGKIRLGWDDDSLNYLDVAKTIQDHGGAMVAVHGRTRVQAYRGKARWAPIREIKQALQIPVVGNGDVRTVADIDAIKAQTGCDAVMVGRAAVANPWIFSRLDRDQVPNAVVRQTLHQHLDDMLAFYGERGVITFRKYLKACLRPYNLSKERRMVILKSTDPQFVKDEIDALLT
ncbi:MAG: tRNA-dihydrouridine synthase [Chloroflexota bacterium]|nr:tRNA-dihydrouridine synthase [Chloroflexota bacterium]